jgi:(1->4)-alpha-D-glucan 1-alpha-D-glucosylmutase
VAPPTSTYRLQVRPTWDLDAAASTCGHLATVGAGAVYLSPLLPSAHGSEHGYDVVRFDTVDPQRGGRPAWARLLDAARAHDLRVVVDIVPNHTGVADAAENPAWWDMLRHGQRSPFARWFDIDWSRGRVLLPVLGDDFTPDQLRVEGEELHYYEHRFPIAPGTGPDRGETAAAVHERQHYELANFRRADTEQNYRRFFAVSTLAGLRVEDPEVFAPTHAEIGRWLTEDAIDGLRIDHPDGLVDPKGYLDDLRDLAGAQAWIVVEKILESGEELPTDWPVAGTTGYDALAEVCGVFVDPAGERPLEHVYRDLTGDLDDVAAHIRRGKGTAATTILRAEIRRLARLVPGVDRAEDALTELVISFPVYRSYLPRTGAGDLATAIETARAARPDLADPIGALASRLADGSDELAKRFQQTSGAVMAKGVEDTAFYRYTRFIALNEVGGDPSRFGVAPPEFHSAQRRRQDTSPAGMTTLSTHDTKRGEDVRARLAVLAELPHRWRDLAAHLMAAAPIPEPTLAYLLWQTFAGTGLIERERMHAYAEKAMREAAIATTWLDPDLEFEGAVHAAVEAAYDRPEVRDPLSGFIDEITPYGWTNSLGQKLVHLTTPGVPDVYQGTEVWEDSLVDPDNRRPVDFDAIAAALSGLDAAGRPPPVAADGLAKLWVTSRALRLRRARPDAFSDYTALTASGPAAEHVLAFDRGGAVTVATRLPVGLAGRGGWADTVLDVGRVTVDELTGRQVPAQVPLAELLGALPVALLVG